MCDVRCPVYWPVHALLRYDWVLLDEAQDSGKLELEFRSIDKNKPFNRKTNSNWCGEGENPCNSNNTTVQKVIKERNDSYNRTGAGALYTIDEKATMRKSHEKIPWTACLQIGNLYKRKKERWKCIP